MRKVFSIAMLIVGTVIGAGFCSGREIISFFGSGVSVIVAPLCAAGIFGVCVLFLFVGAKINERSFDKVNHALLGKAHAVADVFLAVNNLIVLSAMIAGFNSLCKPILSVPILGGAAAILCAVISLRGSKGMLDFNLVIVPFIIVTITAVCLASLRTDVINASVGVFKLRSIPAALVYVSMNMMLASTVLTTLGELNRKQILWGSLIAALSIGVLMALIIIALNCTGNYDAEMPILEISAGAGRWLYIALSIVTGVSIFTTMLTAVGGLCGYLRGMGGGKVFSALIVVAVGVLLSNIGFSGVVDFFYPLVGLFGIAYIFTCLRYAKRGGLLKPPRSAREHSPKERRHSRGRLRRQKVKS